MIRILFILFITNVLIFTVKSQNEHFNKSEFGQNTDFTVSSHFMIFKGFAANLFSVQPSFSKSLTDKFTLRSGCSFQTFTLFPSRVTEHNFFQPLHTLSVYSSGSWRMSNNILLFGGFIHSVPLFQQNKNLSGSQTVFAGAEYRTKEENVFGISFTYSHNNFPYFYSPFESQFNYLNSPVFNNFMPSRKNIFY